MSKSMKPIAAALLALTATATAAACAPSARPVSGSEALGLARDREMERRDTITGRQTAPGTPRYFGPRPWSGARS